MKGTSLTSTAASSHLMHVKKFGKLTLETRKAVYIQSLQLPLNYRHLTELSKGPVRSLPEHSNEKQLAEVVAALTKHYPDLRIQWLPGIIYPWVKLFPKDPLAQFQISLSYLLNWYGPILKNYPSPSKELMNIMGQQLPQIQKKLKELGQGMGQLVWPSFLVSLTDILNKADWLQVFDWLMVQPEFPELLPCFYIELLKYLEPEILAASNIQQMHKILRKQRGIQMKKVMEFSEETARNNPSFRELYGDCRRWPIPKGRYPVHHFLSRNLQLMQQIGQHQHKQEQKLQQQVQDLEQQLRRKNAELRNFNQQNMTEYADKLDQALRQHLRTVSQNNHKKLEALREVQQQLRQWLHHNEDYRRQQSDTISDYVQRRAMLERAIQQSKEETRVTHQMEVDALYRLKKVLTQKEQQEKEKLQRLHEQLHPK